MYVFTLQRIPYIEHRVFNTLCIDRVRKTFRDLGKFKNKELEEDFDAGLLL